MSPHWDSWCGSCTNCRRQPSSFPLPIRWGRCAPSTAWRSSPGLVEITTWRPDETATEEQTYDWIEYGGVARKQP
jgi:hypothetical protein